MNAARFEGSAMCCIRGGGAPFTNGTFLMELFFQIAVMILVPIILALAGWLTKLSQSVFELRIHIAEKYISREALQPFRDDLEYVKKISVRLAEKMHVSTE